MAKRGSWVSVKRGDHERVLVTETLPFETPIIFSGDGFYWRMKENATAPRIQQELANILVLRRGPKPAAATEPFLYKIRKGASEFRRLAVVHPSALWDVRNFYEKFDEWMIYECSLSPFSIRAPYKISGSFYERNDSDAMNQFKKGQITTSDFDAKSRYNPSYFSYRKFTRLYKFFGSAMFTDLEQRFSLLKTLDTSRCFDSIYTHSITWASMGKAIAKDARKRQTCAGDFDALMQSINYGETSGIIIGPEVSRIFAEIIFQRIDIMAMERLKRFDLHYKKDYEVYRYVDDVYIFANSAAVVQQVYDSYTDAMAQFNLHSNPQKSTDIPRPFVTHKSEVIESAKRFIEHLGMELFEKTLGIRGQLRPLKNLNRKALVSKFVADLRSLCYSSEAKYEDLSSYVLSACCERIKRLVKRKRVIAIEEQSDYRIVICVLLKLMFFLYTVAPTVNASYRFATGVTLLLRFSRTKLDGAGDVEQLIYEESIHLLGSEAQRRRRALSSFVSLEALNVLVVVRELGADFLLPKDLLERLFLDNSEMGGVTEWCYFDLITCLYYIGNHPGYAALRSHVDKEIDRRLDDMKRVDRKAELAYLFLDILACPYISISRKEAWLEVFRKAFTISTFTSSEVNAYLGGPGPAPWFVGWGNVDILTLLQKKELVPSY